MDWDQPGGQFPQCGIRGGFIRPQSGGQVGGGIELRQQMPQFLAA
jgi:hypothetical protein